jgi:rubrerythrin
MANLKGSRTEHNLLASFAGESQARNRYNLFASAASKEGYEQIAEIFNATAENERLHAKGFFKFLEGGEVQITATYPAGKVGTTLENLKAAAAGEHMEHEVLYPEAAKIARAEGFNQIAAYFDMVAKVEVEHERRYVIFAELLEHDGAFREEKKARWVCRKCGYIADSKEAPKVCPLCGHPQAYFERDRPY